LALGDSKGSSYSPHFEALSGRRYEVDPANVGGHTVANMRAIIDATLASSTRKGAAGSYRGATVTIGANDVPALPDEATWNANLSYVLDAVHAWAPQIPVGVALPWRRTYDAECDVLAGRIAAVVGARTWAFVGPDERIILKGSDDGASETTDGVHPTTEVYARGIAPAWWAALPVN
jgi:hypothetical protein